MIPVENRVADPLFVAGLVAARGVRVAPSAPGLAALIDALVARRAAEAFPSEELRASVRGLLKRGGFKPSGRNKPASEYLCQAAREGRFPRINNLVDVNNLLSLETGLPISLLDLSAFSARPSGSPLALPSGVSTGSTEGGEKAVLRYGKPGEKYVFNSAGQEIDLEGLLCACSGGDAPLGNAVKDSMQGKLKDATSAALGVIYGSADHSSGRDMAAHVERFAALLKEFGGASETETLVLKGA